VGGWNKAGSLKTKFVITLNGYLDSTELMEFGPGDDDRSLDTREMVDFRSVIGSAGYMVAAFIPGLSVEVSMLGRLRVVPTVRSARKANAVIRFAKDNRQALTFQLRAESFLVFADSAGPNESGTQGRRIYCIVLYF
jgi:hypothetical protein